MLDGIEALLALERYGTVSESATRLRLTQSAVSKRIQVLQAELGFRLTEPDGRRLRLTSEAQIFLERARPLLAELRSLGQVSLSRSSQQPARAEFSLALADSIASSWGPHVVRKVLDRPENRLQIRLHAHRSVLLIENIRLGRYHMGLCSVPSSVADLISFPIVRENFALVHSGFKRKLDRQLKIITIETSSATWRSIESSVRANASLMNSKLASGYLLRVESFTAALQMVKAGFGNGLVPVGIVREMKLDRRCYQVLPDVGRDIALVTRKTVSQLDAFHRFHREMAVAARSYFGETV